MSLGSLIGWCDHTWNIVIGCDPVSPGCDLCFAVETSNVRQHNPNSKVSAAFAGVVERRPDGSRAWTGKVNFLETRLSMPLRIRKPSRIFVTALGDLFHDQVPDEAIARVFAIMALASRHTFQLLTKRHGRARALLSSERFQRAVQVAIQREKWTLGVDAPAWCWPIRNVQLIVSAEDQKRADLRIPVLLDTPAAVRGVSLEPLLGPVDVAQYLTAGGCHTLANGESFPALCNSPSCGTRLDWVIVGGESGHGARPMHPQWARSIRDQAVAAGVPLFFKQWGSWVPPSQMPESTFMDWDLAYGTDMVDRDIPVPVGNKKRAGNELDGQRWEQFPPSHHDHGAAS
jgi:protein gp37